MENKKNILLNNYGMLPIEFVKEGGYEKTNVGDTPFQVICFYNAFHNEVIARNTSSDSKAELAKGCRNESIEFITDEVNDFDNILKAVKEITDEFEEWKGV